MMKKPPLYQRIALHMEDRIRSGMYKPGQKIPTIRRIALEFGCNKITAQKAFDQLQRNGIIENKVGSGSYVQFPHNMQPPVGRFDFRTDYLDPSLFSYDQLRIIINDLFTSEGAAALSPAPVEGEPSLMDTLGHFYQLPVGGMLIISGAQQGLDLVAKVFKAKISDAILFEDPTYPGAISLFKARHFVPLQADGPDMDALVRQLDDSIQLFYTMPAVHNPTGMTYSLDKMKAVAALARQNGFYIIEDDYLGELHRTGLRFVDICPERTIHIKSFAQTTLAGIRLGFMVVPDEIYTRFIHAKFTSDISSFGLLQRAWLEFIRCGAYAAHLEAVTRTVEHRRTEMYRLIGRHPHLSAASDQVGYSLWIRSRREMSQEQMPWEKGASFSFTPYYRNFFKISFMHMPDETFIQGLDYLSKLLDV
jgi:2-aminoadipate transaminase